MLPRLASEVLANERRLLFPGGLSETAEVVAEVAHRRSPGEREALGTLLYLAASFTESRSEQDQRLGWDQVLSDDRITAQLELVGVSKPVIRTLAVVIDAYLLKTARLSELLQQADAKWMGEGQKTFAPEHRVDDFIGLASRRYLLEIVRLIRQLASEPEVAAIENLAMKLTGVELKLPSS